MAPSFLLVPLVVLATIATIIASQALISGAFSVTRQLMQLGYLPRLRIRHTSVEQRGQIYIPFMNWALFLAVTLAVVYFRSSGALASAYGLAVCGLMFITTILTFFVIRYSWRLPLMVCLLATGFFLAIDLTFLLSALIKIPSGGWFPLLIAAAIFLLMTSWYRGQLRLTVARRRRAVELEPLLESIFKSPPSRVPGTAVFLTSAPQEAPSAFLHNLKHNKVLHHENLFLTLVFHEQPWIPIQERVEAYPLGNRCFRVLLHYGYQDDPHVPIDLSGVSCGDYEFVPESTSYFIGRDAVISGSNKRRYPKWQNKAFVYMHRNASSISDYLKLPSNAVVELGGLIEI